MTANRVRPEAVRPTDELLTRTFVELTDVLVGDFDVVPFLQMLSTRCVELFDLKSAGVMIQDSQHALRIVASSDEQALILELMELQSQEGPCLDAYRTSKPVQVLADEASTRWPTFTAKARDLGFHAFTALPLRSHAKTIGAVNLFSAQEVLLHADDARSAQALADVATISLLNERALRESRRLAEQLQNALSSRVVLEQAKGILAVRLDCTVDEAFVVLRDHCRNNNLRLSEVARAIVDGGRPPTDFVL